MKCSIILLKDLPYQYQRNIDTLYVMPIKNEREIFATSIESAEEKVRKAVIDLQNRHPWFGHFINYLNLKKTTTEGSPSASIDERGDLIYNAECVKNLKINEIKAILCHEILHLALQHPFMVNKRNFILYNLAADLKINSIISRTKSLNDLKLSNALMVPLSSEREGIELFWRDPVIINDISQKTTDQIYYELSKELPFKLKIKTLSRRSKKGEKGGEIDADTSKLPKRWKPLIDRMIKELSLDKNDNIKPTEAKKFSKEWRTRTNKANQQFKKDIPVGFLKEFLTLKKVKE